MANNIIQPKPVKITETVLRDAHQSLIATRMTTDEILPIVETLDGIGYHSLEAWGGATFDSCLRFLNEDPWERLRKIKDRAKKTPLQMLFRGQNILGYRHYADDIVQYFVQASIANGIDILRIFDALNDVRNLECAINATKEYCAKEGRGHVQATVCYTTSEFHTNEKFVEMAKQLESMGADSICIKDMAGLLKPYVTYDLVSKMKQAVNIPIQLHTHYTSGEASMVYLKAIEAGVDVVDCAMSPLAMGTSQPPTEPLVAALQGTPYDTGLDLDKLIEASNYFKPLREKYIESGLMNAKVMGVDVNTLRYQVPGGMLSNLVSQLKQQGREDAFDAVLEEVPRVRADLGYPPLVTPSSQIVGTQAVLNVLMGERYKMVSKETKAIVRGEYGKCPGEIDPELVKKIIGDDERITCRPADKLKPELENMKKECAEWIRQPEDVLSYALFDQVAVKYFKYREANLDKIDNTLVDRENKVYPV
ncbi:MAG: oxaloacetate decarboxylase subunit alpha [Clostridia bacterium]|nr:oxaloacetate decarboxylase subunit alpha [Clostridia bacterium]